MNAPSPKVLLVDDLQENLVALEALIRKPGREVYQARSGEAALELMLEHDFALAMLDVQMPTMNGFELAELMRGTERTRRIPIVFVTAAGKDLNFSFKGYELGAVDVLFKPLDPHAVRSKVSVFCDLYAQRHALEEARRELQRSVKVRDDFISMVSHELRTPLNTLFLQIQLRQRLLEGNRADMLDATKLREMAQRDDRQVRNMIRLIDDMLDATRASTGKLAIAPKPCDLAELVRRVAATFADQAAAQGVTLTCEAPATLAAVCDEFRMEQVVTNLITNALRYGAGQPIAMTLDEEGGRARIRVRDGGPGIAPEEQARIFEQFQRADGVQNRAGLGLGLFICRQIVEAHGGRIVVDSAPGAGSTFTVLLPRSGVAGAGA